MSTFRQQIRKVSKEEGFKSVEDFINAWVRGGQTFQSLHEWLTLEKGITRCKATVWNTMRDYLTIPYSSEDQFWYRWEAIAKAKGFKDPKHMIHIFRQRKLCLEEMAEELGVTPNMTPRLIQHLLLNRVEGKIIPKRKYKTRRKFKMSRDRDGISFKETRERWRAKLQALGFRSLKDAVWKLKKRGLKKKEMAKVLGVSVRGFRFRMRRAGL